MNPPEVQILPNSDPISDDDSTSPLPSEQAHGKLQTGGEQGAIWGVSRNTFVLGWVSFFTDLASETIYPLLPLFLANTLGVDKSLIGLIEGIAESTASLTKFGSGWLADRTGRIKLLVGIGYGLSAVGRPFFALVTAPWQVLVLRVTDRIGKGIRTAPRDALIAASNTPEQLGRSFGIHRAMDQSGAILGPALAMLLLASFHGHYQSVFLLASLPGFVAIWLVVAKVRETRTASVAQPPHLVWQAFDLRFKLFILSTLVFALGNSSNAFLLLRANNLGVSETLVPLTYLVYNLVYVLVSVPAGILSDRVGRPVVIIAGYLAFALVYWGFGLATATWQAWALFGAYGLFSGLNEGVQRAWIGDLAPAELRGSAFGVYHLAVGFAALPASLLTGYLWDHAGPRVAFSVDAGLAMAAMAIFTLSLWQAKKTVTATK